MPTAKATSRKAAQGGQTTKKPAGGRPVAAKKAASGTAKKVTQADIEANFDRIQKTLDEIARAHKETQQAHRETEETLNRAIDDFHMSHRETEETLNRAIDDLHMSHRETKETLNRAIDDLHMRHKETEQAHKETEETLNRAIDDLHMSHKETEKTLNRAIGGLSNTLGSLVEHIMTPDLPRKFRQFGFTFDRITTVKWADGEGNVYTEIDGLLENGRQAMVVEVKTTLRHDDIDDHLERMKRVRKYAEDHGDTRDFLAAMAAMVIGKDTKEYALSKGFFVIEPSGEDVKITEPASGPAIW